jgi:hypothetical protein
MTMSERKTESLEEVIWAEFDAQIKVLESLSRDPWLRPELRIALETLAYDVDKAYGKFERSQRSASGETDNGPTRADERGEVQHDIG